MRKSWHNAPAPTITAEAIKMQREKSVEKFHKEIGTLKTEVAELSIKKANLSAVIDEAVKIAVDRHNEKFDELNARDQEISEGTRKLKQAEDAFDQSSTKRDKILNDALKEIHEDKLTNQALLRSIHQEKNEVKTTEEKIESKMHDLSRAEDRVGRSLKNLDDSMKSFELEKSAFDKKDKSLKAEESRITRDLEMLRISREGLAKRKQELEHQMRNSQTVKQGAEEQLDKLKEETDKVAHIRQALKDTEKGIRLGSKHLSDKEAQLKMREKGLSTKEKELNKREAYIKLKDVALTANILTKAQSIRYGQVFGLSIKATGTGPDLDIYMQQSHTLPATEGASDATWVIPEGIAKLIDITDTNWHHLSISPVVLPYLRFLCDGQGANGADVVLTMKLTTQEES